MNQSFFLPIWYISYICEIMLMLPVTFFFSIQVQYIVIETKQKRGK